MRLKQADTFGFLLCFNWHLLFVECICEQNAKLNHKEIIFVDNQIESIMNHVENYIWMIELYGSCPGIAWLLESVELYLGRMPVTSTGYQGGVSERIWDIYRVPWSDQALTITQGKGKVWKYFYLIWWVEVVSLNCEKFPILKMNIDIFPPSPCCLSVSTPTS